MRRNIIRIVSILAIIGLLCACGNTQVETAAVSMSEVSEAASSSLPSAQSEKIFMRARLTGAAMDILDDAGKTISANSKVTVTDQKGTRRAYSGQYISVFYPAEISITVDFYYDGNTYSATQTETLSEDDFKTFQSSTVACIEVPFLVPLTVTTKSNGVPETKNFGLNYSIWFSEDSEALDAKVQTAIGDSQYILTATPSASQPTPTPTPTPQPYCGIWIKVTDYCADYNHVGNEWTTDHYISLDGSNYTKLEYSYKYGGYCKWVNASEPLRIYIKTYISEYDDSMSDSCTNWYDTVLDIDPETQGSGTYWTVNQWCEIVENGGRYIYNSCTWDTTWTFTLLYGEK